MTEPARRCLLVLIGLAFSTAMAAAHPARGGAAEPGAYSSPRPDRASDKAKSNWRTRAILEQQRNATGKSGRMSGEETRIILDHYERSIGKGGAGAKLLPQNENPTSGMSR